MKKLLNPKWLFLINTLPLIIFFVLEWNEYKVVKSFLSEDILSIWQKFFIALSMLLIGNVVYAIYQLINKRRIDLIYCIVSFVVHLIFVYVYYEYQDKMCGFDVPNWIVSSDRFLYGGTFVIPTLLYLLFLLVIRITPLNKEEKAWKSFVCALAIPIMFYMLGVMISPLWNGSGSEHPFFIMMIIGIVIFLFFIFRFIYVLMSRKNTYSESSLFWLIPVSLLFPLTGLVLNYSMDNIFGDFSDAYFYCWTVINSIFLCLPSNENYKYRLFLFVGRSVTFVYTLYFFFVMIPYLPLSLFAIIIFGAGLLMLTPIVLLMIHVKELNKDFRFLAKKYKKVYLYMMFIVSLTVIPLFVTFSYISDKKMFHKTLEYLYSPDYTKEYKLSSRSVLKTLNVIDSKTHRSFFSSNINTTPYLSRYYKWLVLDNMSVSTEKKKMIKNLFEGSKIYSSSRNRAQDVERKVDIRISDIKHTSKYDTAKKAWVSWIDISIENGDTPLWNAEYITQFDLPVGCWISDYYLYVGDVKEMGILAEKRAATWVFNSIRNVNRDPGLLRYLSGNRIEFKVFPFQKYETRYTGIEFTHKEPVQIEIDGHILNLGDTQVQLNSNKSVDKEGVMYLSAEDKEKLPTVKRTPYYHFIVDTSGNKSEFEMGGRIFDNPNDENYANDYIVEINNLLDKNLIDRKDARISYTNTYVKTSALGSDWEKTLKEQSFEGGFFLDRAVKKVMFDSYSKSEDKYPVIVIVSYNIEKAILLDGFGDLLFTMPETNLFYSLSDRVLRGHHWLSGLKVVQDDIKYVDQPTVKAWPSLSNPQVYLPDDSQPSVFLNTKDKTLNNFSDGIEVGSWNTGLMLQGQWMLQSLYPETADNEWLNLVKNSFKSKIMTPLTSYIVVETQSQKIMLKRKQEEALSGNRVLDLNDETQRMSEPDLYILICILALIVAFYEYKRRRKVKE
ncbi:MAG: MSEP-CTERM sorting domain-containing protein [Dysgonomonas sp.]|nr:MSEP-CTERM sorting domain-containing protein [Dysgonomonas sp.]